MALTLYTDLLVTKSANVTVTTSDTVVLCNGTFNVTLYTAVGNVGRRLLIKNIGSGTVTVIGASAQNIDGANTYTLAANQTIVIDSDGTQWWILAAYTQNVLAANNASYLGGNLPAYYTNATNLASGTVPSARLPLANTTIVGAMDINAQSFAGVKTFAANAIFNGVTFANGAIRCDTTNGRLVLPVGSNLWA